MFKLSEKRDIKGYQHISILNSRTSAICLSRAFLTWDKDKQPIDHNVAFAVPPLHPNCRSHIKVLFDKKKTEPSTVDDWLDEKTDKEQDEILGKGKAQMYRANKITLRDMLDQSGRPLTLAQLKDKYVLPRSKSAVDSMYGLYEKIEPKITADMKTIVGQSGAKLGGLDYRLKTKESLVEKLYKRDLLHGKDPAEEMKEMNDIVRYTSILDENKFVSQYHKIKDDLVTKGYETVMVKNTWEKNAAYKGINTYLKKDDLTIEMQYHTKQSFDLKNGKLHDLYEEFRLPELTRKDKMLLMKEMKKLSDDIPQIKGIENI